MHRVHAILHQCAVPATPAACANATASQEKRPAFSPCTFGDQSQYRMRPLELGDFAKGYINILSQLTTVGTITKEMFEDTFNQIQAAGDTYNILVIEDTFKHKVIGAAGLLLERKFIHACGKVGHIEDVVVDSTYRGLALGRRLIDALKEIAVGFGCYKIILDCDKHNVPFYEKLGYKEKALHMANYLE